MRSMTAFALAAALMMHGAAHGQNAPVVEYDEAICGPLGNPHDYRTATSELKGLVEGAHFNQDVESLKGYYNESRGIRVAPGGDIDYTLRQFPNHPRALYALIRLQEKERKLKPAGMRWPVPCYFERAIRFRPDDGSVRLVFGIYLLKYGKNDGAVRELEFAKSALGEDAVVTYNLGLAYFAVGKYDLAVAEAKRARELGFPLDGLQNKLKRAGKWTE